LSNEYYAPVVPTWENRDTQKVEFKRASRDEVIKYLEAKVKLLEDALYGLRDYYGEDYYQATKELEMFLKESRVIVKEAEVKEEVEEDRLEFE